MNFIDFGAQGRFSYVLPSFFNGFFVDFHRLFDISAYFVHVYVFCAFWPKKRARGVVCVMDPGGERKSALFGRFSGKFIILAVPGPASRFRFFYGVSVFFRVHQPGLGP